MIFSRRIFAFTIIALCACSVPTRRIPTAQDYVNAKQIAQQGHTHLLHDHTEQAMAHYTMAEAIAPNPESALGMGCLALKQKNSDKAEHFFKLTLEIDPSFARAYGYLALVEVQRGNMKLAQSYFEEALAKAPRDYRARANYAILLYAHGKTEQARKLAAEAVILGEDDPEILDKLELFYTPTNKLEER